MSKLSGYVQIAAREFWINWKFFRMTMLISVLLLTTMLASLSIIYHIPQALNQYLDQFLYTEIAIDHVKPEDIPTFSTLPVTICGYRANGLSNHAVGLPETCSNSDFLLLAGGMIGKDDEHMHIDNPVRKIRRNLLSGSSWTKEDDTEPGIWLSLPAATLMNVQVGDHVPFQIDDLQYDIVYQNISLPVKGIYKVWPACSTYYITLPSYEQSCGSSTFMLTAFIKCDNLLQIRRIKSELNARYLSVQADFEIVDSMTVLITALYIISGGLCILEFLVMHSQIRSYCSQRVRFYSILSAVGLGSGGMVNVIGLLITGIVTICYLLGWLLSPLIVRYVCDTIRIVFGDIDLYVNHLNPFVFAVYPVLLFMVFLLSLLYARSCRTMDIADQLRNNEENG